MKIGFFDTAELESRDGARSPYGNMVCKPELLAMLNRIRRRWGGPIIVNSAFRSREHNRAVGGVDNSFHVQGLAADIRPERHEDLPALQDLCLDMVERGGVGLYDNFVHIDCRGVHARWDNRSAK